jgi:hypothetical protein
MISPLQKKLTAIILCFALLSIPRQAKADSLENAAIGVIVASVAVGVGIGVGVFLLIHHHSSSITGCTTSNENNLTLVGEGDQLTYALSGDIADIKPGDRVHVSGKKSKDSAGKHTFTVGKVVKDYGPCNAATR